MNHQLEDDLREAFALHASGMPTEVGERLRRIDYHPRTSRISPRLTVGALAGAAATTVVVVSVVVLGGAPAAFAGWTASPTPAVSGQTATASSNCQAQLVALPNTPPASGWSAVTTDLRGPYSLVIYQDGGATASCLTGPSLTAVSISDGDAQFGSVAGSGNEAGGGSSSTMIGTSGSGSIEHISVAHMASASQGAYTLVEGQIASDVTAVTLVRTDGVDIQASTGNGWFLAWWPGPQDVTSAEVTTPSGVTTQALNTSPPPSGSCDLNLQTTSSTVLCTNGAVAGNSEGPSTSASH
ncbi:MAG: hypothetical protein ACLP1E_11400 [Acidimicrobiales bacterium]